MEGKLPRVVRSIEEMPGKLTVSLRQIDATMILVLFIGVYGLILVYIGLNSYYRTNDSELTFFVYIFLLSTMSIPFIWMLAVYFKCITIQCDAESQVLVAAGKRSHTQDAGSGVTFFTGTVPLSEIKGFELNRVEITGPKGTWTHYSIAARRNDGSLLNLHHGSKDVMEFLVEKLNAWFSNAR